MERKEKRMKNMLKGLTIAAAVLALGGVILSAAYTHTVSEEVTNLRRESRSDLVYLRTRVRELESELTASLLDRLTPPSQAVDGVVDDETEQVSPDTEADQETESEINSDSESESESEEVTVPAHKAPETGEPTEDTVETGEPTEDTVETDAPAAMYLLTAYNGVIGVFDASGDLVRTINVFVMTLPKAEQEALAVGIPAYTHEEMCALAEQYE